MKVTEAFTKDSPALSFEFFPPKTLQQEEHLFNVITQLKKFNPAFVSVTYGAMGTSREKTFYWVKEIKHRFNITPVAHLTCVAANREDIACQIDHLEKIGIENILALRGDPPEGQKDFTPPAGGFRYAKELIAFIRKEKPQFCLGAAGFPEAPQETIAYLKEKVDAGAEYIITQLFFDNRHYFDFLERCHKAGIYVPIIAGIMPVTSFKQVKKMTKVCGATVPPRLFTQLENARNDRNAVQQIGIEHAVAQCQELIAAKVKGLHFFVMNQAGPISQILTTLR